MDKNRMRGDAGQGEQAMDCKALVAEAWRRKCGGGAGKDRALTWGDLVLRLKGRRREPWARSQQRS